MRPIGSCSFPVINNTADAEKPNVRFRPIADLTRRCDTPRVLKRKTYEWDPRPPTVRERVIAGVWLAPFAIAMANYYAGWRLFGDYDKWVFGGLFLVGLFLLTRMPRMKRT